jgi:plastocyanin
VKAIGWLGGVVVAAVVLVAALALGARMTGSSASSDPPTIALEDVRFTPNRIDAKVGVPLTVRLVNKGTVRHDLNFEALHMPGLAGVESILEVGETRTITLTFDEPGTHTFICTLPGHAASGMTGAAFVSR